MSILAKIVDQKRERLLLTKRQKPLAELRSAISASEPPRDFQDGIRRARGGPIRLIAEIKKASPSKGLIRASFNHKAIASVYEEKRADAISVLTEEDFFQGDLAFIPDVRKIATCPILRKDFIFDEYQIYEARANGADAILLIASIVSDSRAGEFLHLSRELSLSVLFEIHDHKEMEMALRLEAPIIGINNRDLKTLTIDLSTSLKLKQEIPMDKTVVSESGIETRQDVVSIEDSGIDAMLIGTSFMKSSDIGRKIDELRGTA